MGDAARARAWYDALRHGDEAAFAALFDAYYAPLCRFVRAYAGSAEEAEDVVQGVFLRLWRDRADSVVAGSVVAYLYVAVRNAALNRGRDERRRAEIVESAPVLRGEGVPGPRTPLEELERAEIQSAVRAALESLPERARLAATLRWQHQLSSAETAIVMGISSKGVENLVNRAFKILRPLLTHWSPVG